MLLTKQSRQMDGAKLKNAEPNKKTKKNKNSSPNKLKVTPEKKLKKDENVLTNRLSYYNNTQPIDLHKSKDKDGWKNKTKRYTNNPKNKLLTTSPVLLDRSHSNQHKKSKDKSKSRSVTRVHTQRSHFDRDKDVLFKNVTRKLYSHVKEQQKDKSHSKSKSKSKSKTRIYTDRDVSPIREPKSSRGFNVADRQIKLKKTAPTQPKKLLKKKAKHKKIEQTYSFMPTDRYQNQKNESKVKLKKQVPQIKTQFSERRGSFFDEKLLDRLQLRQPQQKCPFVHIKSNFEFQAENKNAEVFSRSELNTYEQMSSTASAKDKQLEQFKRQQELKWNLMLSQLQGLKQEERVPERIDDLIRQLNENYSSLQERAQKLMKSKSQERQQGQYQIIGLKPQKTSYQKSNTRDETVKLRNREEQKKNNRCQDVSHSAQLSYHTLLTQKQASLSQQNKKIEPELETSKPFDQVNRDCELVQEQYKQVHEIQVKDPMAIEVVQIQFKKSNNIDLSSDFFQFFQKKDKLQLEILPNENNNLSQKSISPQSIKESNSHQASDRDILSSLLQANEGHSDFVEVISFSKNNKCQFETQLQSLRQQQYEHFHHEDAPRFTSEIQMGEQMSSESILLQSDRNIKMEQLLTEVENSLVLEFCTTILKSKQILHNFLTTYSQLVDAHIINTNYQPEENRHQIPSDNNHVLQLLQRLINHLKVNYKHYFLEQIQIPFECKPIQILKFIRCSDEEPTQFMNSERDNGEPIISMPFFELDKIEEFEKEVLRNQYYIPNYFSFNHCVYDFFNDNIDELRPYGSKGKPIFSIQLSHPITSFEVATEKIVKRCEQCLSMNYYEETLPDEKYPSEQGIFELVYFTCLDVMEDFFEQEALVIFQIMKR